MASIKNLEMATAISSNEHITIKKSFLGQKAVYNPTQSPIEVKTYEYSPGEGERMERLLRLPLDKLQAEIGAKGKPASTPVGHFRLECCVSRDGQFAAMQLFRFGDFKYQPASEAIFCEGNDAGILTQLI